MAFFKIDNVKIAGISACVPPKQVENIDSILIEYGAQNEAYMSRSAEKLVRDLCFNELGVGG